MLPAVGVQAVTQQQRARTALRASAAATVAYTNPIGVHALVFAGDWTEAFITAAASGAANVRELITATHTFSPTKMAVQCCRLRKCCA
jgi:hypothetical protein